MSPLTPAYSSTCAVSHAQDGECQAQPGAALEERNQSVFPGWGQSCRASTDTQPDLGTGLPVGHPEPLVCLAHLPTTPPPTTDQAEEALGRMAGLLPMGLLARPTITPAVRPATQMVPGT